MGDGKYVVFKREEWRQWIDEWPEVDPEAEPAALEDAVVIRRQDVFAPPALDAYANAIQTCVEVLCNGTSPSGRAADLQKIADYFHTQAQLAWDTVRKLPD